MRAFEPLPVYSLADVPPNYDAGKAEADFFALSDDEKARLSTGIAIAASHEDATPHFKEAALTAAEAVDRINKMFISLTAKLMSLQDTEQFVKTFDIIKQHFRNLVTTSHELAVGIAVYAEQFDKVIVKFCADERLTVDQRIAQINKFIQEGDQIKSDAKAMESGFTDLTDEFSKFVGSFATWATSREEKDEQNIKDLYAEIKELDKKLEEIDLAIKLIGAALAATLPVTGVLAVLFPPAAPFIIAAGLVTAGIELSTLVGLVIAKSTLLNDKRGKEQKIKDLQDEIGKIKAARTQLQNEGQVDLDIFATNIAAISQVWVHVQNDATDIHKWLQAGANFAEYPEYMKMQLDEGVSVYSSMAKYLKDYANGTVQTVQSFFVKV